MEYTNNTYDEVNIWRSDRINCTLVNSTQRIIITGVYNGIPQTLILNLISWVCLLLLFSILRRSAWNYGRMALVQRSGNLIRNIFFRGQNDNDVLVNNRIPANESASIDDGFCTWLPVIFKVNREQILSKCGPDAVHYLSFQRHIITFMFIITMVSICIILPINFQGDLQGDVSTFSRTTVSNLRADSKWLWVHAFFGISFLPVSILIMRRCTGRKPAPNSMTGTVMITNISKSDRSESFIKAYLMQQFPDLQIVDLRLAYNINQLVEIEEKRELTTQAKQYCEMYLRKSGKPVKVRVFPCGKYMDGLEYYTEEERRLISAAKRCRAMVTNDPLGVAFLTLPSYQVAEYVIKNWRPYNGWVLSHATNPADIFWENLSVEPGVWYIKAIVVNFFLFLTLFFLTTPAIIVNFANAIKFHPENPSKISSLIFDTLPTLILWTMAAVMPAIVSFSDKFLSHWTRSRQNFSIMTKTFAFLLLMTLILPSLGLASAEAFLLWTIHHENNTWRWDCVFLPDKGAFFVNYVITSSFIGTALELIRFPELFLYVCYLLLSKSKAEKSYVKKAILYEFPFGSHYAWSLCIFSIVVVYSLTCPLITPFGLIYFCFKHIGDKHNLYFAYGPSDMSGVGGGKIHATAVRLVRVSVLLLQIAMAALAGLRGGFDVRTIVLIMSAIVTLGTLLLLSPFPSCTPPLPLQEDTSSRFREYVAPVLLKPAFEPSTDNNQPLPDYGSGELTDHSYHTNRAAAVRV